MVVAFINKTGSEFIFNLGSDIGPHCRMYWDDMEFVQFAFYCATQSNTYPALPDEMPVFRAVPLGHGAYTQRTYDPMFVAIAKWQSNGSGTTKDGIVSRLQSASKIGYGPSRNRSIHMIIFLNGYIRDVTKATWPRIDLHPRCPSELKIAVRKVFLLT